MGMIIIYSRQEPYLINGFRNYAHKICHSRGGGNPDEISSVFIFITNVLQITYCGNKFATRFFYFEISIFLSYYFAFLFTWKTLETIYKIVPAKKYKLDIKYY